MEFQTFVFLLFKYLPLWHITLYIPGLLVIFTVYCLHTCSIWIWIYVRLDYGQILIFLTTSELVVRVCKILNFRQGTPKNMKRNEIISVKTWGRPLTTYNQFTSCRENYHQSSFYLNNQVIHKILFDKFICWTLCFCGITFTGRISFTYFLSMFPFMHLKRAEIERFCDLIKG